MLDYPPPAPSSIALTMQFVKEILLRHLEPVALQACALRRWLIS